VLADVQTAGRGRHGQAWNDVPGSSLAFSVLLRHLRSHCRGCRFSPSRWRARCAERPNVTGAEFDVSGPTT
jgi:hypothetical protein